MRCMKVTLKIHQYQKSVFVDTDLKIFNSLRPFFLALNFTSKEREGKKRF